MKSQGLATGFRLEQLSFLLPQPNGQRRPSAYELSLSSRLDSLKMRHSVYSNLTERPRQESVVLLSSRQVDKVAGQFEKIKKSRHEGLPSRRSYFRDRLYKTLEGQMAKSNQAREEVRGTRPLDTRIHPKQLHRRLPSDNSN